MEILIDANFPRCVGETFSKTETFCRTNYAEGLPRSRAADRTSWETNRQTVEPHSGILIGEGFVPLTRVHPRIRGLKHIIFMKLAHNVFPVKRRNLSRASLRSELFMRPRIFVLRLLCVAVAFGNCFISKLRFSGRFIDPAVSGGFNSAPDCNQTRSNCF